MSRDRWLARHTHELAGTLVALTGDADRVDRWGQVLAARLAAGARLLVAGNGGSAAEAQHLTAELVGRFVQDRRPYSAIALHAETSSLTAIVNDYGADEVFARQVEAHGRTGDVLVLLSTSGRSANVLRAAARGRALGLHVWALTGPGPNPLADAVDEAVTVPGASTAAVQEAHLVLVHALCAAVEAHLPTPAPSPTEAEPDPLPPATDAERSPGPHAGRSGAPHVVVVGDVVLDRDVEGTVERLCPDGPAPVLDVATTHEAPGGAGLAAALCARDGARVTLIAPLAADDDGVRISRWLQAAGVDVLPLGHRGPTRRKVRVRSQGRSLVRVDEGGPGTPTSVPSEAVRTVLASADAVLVSDYGAGTSRDELLRAELEAVAHRVPVVWDPHPRGGAPVPGTALVTPNLDEARGTLGAPATDPADVLARRLRQRWHADTAVTAGTAGAFLATRAAEVRFVPATPAGGGDPCGAGDRFAATAAVAMAAGALPSEVVERAVQAASAWVAAGGAEGFHREHPAGRLDEDGRREPDVPRPDTGALAARLRGAGRTLVATGGCFDLVHAGHVATLQAARRLGDALVVLMNSDESVRRLKGPGRPLVPAADRARVLAALDCVDAVVVFDEDDPRAVLSELRPDVWAKGGDYGGAPLPEAAVVTAHGGRVVLLPYLDGRSTTSIIDRAPARTVTEVTR